MIGLLLFDFDADTSKLLIETGIHLVQQIWPDVARILIQSRHHSRHRVLEQGPWFDLLDVILGHELHRVRDARRIAIFLGLVIAQQ